MTYYDFNQRTIAAELSQRGWELYDYRPETYDRYGETDQPFNWTGIATHPDAPGMVLGVYVARFSEDKSGTAQQRSGLPEFFGNQLSPYVLRLPDFPVFHATPKGKSWHVEKDGRIVKTGLAPKRILHPSVDQPIVRQMIDQIEGYVLGVRVISLKLQGGEDADQTDKP